MAVVANVKRLVNQLAKRHARLAIKNVKIQKDKAYEHVSVGQ